MLKSLVLRKLKEHYNFKKDVDLARLLEITPQLLSNWDSRGTFDHHAIYTKCVEINPEWILSNGEGQMLRSDYIQDSTKTTQLKSLISTIYNPTINIPMINVSDIGNVIDYSFDKELNAYGYITLPQNIISCNSVYICTHQKGNSMSPTLFDSDIIVIRLIDNSKWLETQNDCAYLIVDKQKRSYVQRIKNELVKGFITCISDNLDKAIYPNFNLSTNDIQSIWHVELRLSSRMTNINDNYYNRLKTIEDRLDAITQTLNK